MDDSNSKIPLPEGGSVELLSLLYSGRHFGVYKGEYFPKVDFDEESNDSRSSEQDEDEEEKLLYSNFMAPSKSSSSSSVSSSSSSNKANNRRKRQSVIVKKVLPEAFDLLSYNLIKKESFLAARLSRSSPHFLPPFSFFYQPNQLHCGIVWSDVGAISLRSFLDGQPVLNMVLFLRIAIQLANALHKMHSEGVIHKDVKSNNIVILPHSPYQIWLIDLNSASYWREYTDNKATTLDNGMDSVNLQSFVLPIFNNEQPNFAQQHHQQQQQQQQQQNERNEVDEEDEEDYEADEDEEDEEEEEHPQGSEGATSTSAASSGKKKSKTSKKTKKKKKKHHGSHSHSSHSHSSHSSHTHSSHSSHSSHSHHHPKDQPLNSHDRNDHDQQEQAHRNARRRHNQEQHPRSTTTTRISSSSSDSLHSISGGSVSNVSYFDYDTNYATSMMSSNSSNSHSRSSGSQNFHSSASFSSSSGTTNSSASYGQDMFGFQDEQMVDYSNVFSANWNLDRLLSSEGEGGTLEYMSPEQTGKVGFPIDFRSDLYSLGITLFEILLGFTPYSYMTSKEAVLFAQVALPVPHIHSLVKIPEYKQLWSTLHKQHSDKHHNMDSNINNKDDSESKSKNDSRIWKESFWDHYELNEESNSNMGGRNRSWGYGAGNDGEEEEEPGPSSTSSRSNRERIGDGAIFSDMVSAIPKVIADIVAKLLQKNPDDRYQSAYGLLQDLELCASCFPSFDSIMDNVQKMGSTPAAEMTHPSANREVFSAGSLLSSCVPYSSIHHQKLQQIHLRQQDKFPFLRAAKHIYGRDKEIATILQAYEDVEFDQKSHILFVHGFSGTGKSTIVREASERINLQSFNSSYGTGKKEVSPEKNAPFLYAMGKSENEINVPHMGLCQVLNEILRQAVLHHGFKKVYQTTLAAIKSIGISVLLYSHLVPGLEALFQNHKQYFPEPVPVTDPLDAQKRLSYVLCEWVACIGDLYRYQNDNDDLVSASSSSLSTGTSTSSVVSTASSTVYQKKRPMVFFFDDIQWTKSSTMYLMQQLLLHQGILALFVFSYRDNESPELVELKQTLRSWRIVAKIPVTDIHLTSLRDQDVMSIIEDMMGGAEEFTKELAELVNRKTLGNPFFIIQLIIRLHEDRDLWFDFESQHWRVDLNKMETIVLQTDDIVTMLVERIGHLKPKTVQVMIQAACIGITFDLQTLHLVTGKSKEKVLELLSPIQHIGFIQPFRNTTDPTQMLEKYRSKYQIDPSEELDCILLANQTMPGEPGLVSLSSGFGSKKSTGSGSKSNASGSKSNGSGGKSSGSKSSGSGSNPNITIEDDQQTPIKKSTSSNASSSNMSKSKTRGSSGSEGGAVQNIRFRFLHDRVHEGFYTLISKEEKAGYHLKIGRSLIKEGASHVIIPMSEEEGEEHEEGEADTTAKTVDVSTIPPEKLPIDNYFLIPALHHLNLGIPVLQSPQDAAELLTIARLNFKGAKQLQKAASHILAAQLCTHGIYCCEQALALECSQSPSSPSDCWANAKYRLLYINLHLVLVENQYLCQNFTQAEETLNAMSAHVTEHLVQVKIGMLRISMYTNRTKFKEAVQVGIDILSLIGFPIQAPEDASWQMSETERQRILELLSSTAHEMTSLADVVSNMERVNCSLEEELEHINLGEDFDAEATKEDDWTLVPGSTEQFKKRLVIAQGLVTILMVPAYLGQMLPLYSYMALFCTRLCLESRCLTPANSTSFAVAGFSLHAFFQSSPFVLELCQLGIRVAQEFQRGDYLCRALLQYGLVSMFGMSMEQSVDVMKNALTISIDHQDLNNSGFCAVFGSWIMAAGGMNLKQLHSHLRNYIGIAAHHFVECEVGLLGPFLFVDLLRDRDSNNPRGFDLPSVSNFSTCDNPTEITEKVRSKPAIFRSGYWVFIAAAHHILGNECLAWEAMEETQKLLTVIPGMTTEHEFYFWSALIRLQRLEQLQKTESNRHTIKKALKNANPPMEEVGEFVSSPANLQELEDPIQHCKDLVQWINYSKLKLAGYSRSYANNFLHKYLLIEAEILKLRGKFLESIKLYDECIRWAIQYNFIHVAALAAERCALLLLSSEVGGIEVAASSYLQKAYNYYRSWGALKKVIQLTYYVRYRELYVSDNGSHSSSNNSGEKGFCISPLTGRKKPSTDSNSSSISSTESSGDSTDSSSPSLKSRMDLFQIPGPNDQASFLTLSLYRAPPLHNLLSVSDHYRPGRENSVHSNTGSSKSRSDSGRSRLDGSISRSGSGSESGSVGLVSSSALYSAHESADSTIIRQATQILTGEGNTKKIIEIMSLIIMQHAGAEKGFMFLLHKGKLFLATMWNPVDGVKVFPLSRKNLDKTANTSDTSSSAFSYRSDSESEDKHNQRQDEQYQPLYASISSSSRRSRHDKVKMMMGIPYIAGSPVLAEDIKELIPTQLIQHAMDSHQTLDISDVPQLSDRYLAKQQPKSILCLPMINSGETIGALYLENNLIKGAFPVRHRVMLEHLSSQIAISLERSKLTRNLHKTLSEVQRMNANLLQLNKMKDDFVANTSHELRTPLNAIMGVGELLMETSMSQEQRDYVELINASAECLLAVINDILDFRRCQYNSLQLSFSEFDLRQLLDDVIRLLAIRTTSVELHLSIEPAELSVQQVWVKADRLRLQQVLLNLLSNAVKFTPKGDVILGMRVLGTVKDHPELAEIVGGGEISKRNRSAEGGSEENGDKENGDSSNSTSSTSNSDLEDDGKDAEYEESHHFNYRFVPRQTNTVSLPELGSESRTGTPDLPILVEFSVTDTGIGIPKELHSEMFKPFFQVDSSTTRKYEGTGLGLAISQSLIQAMSSVQNSIHLASAAGKGSTFSFVLPLERKARVVSEVTEEIPEVGNTKETTSSVEPSAATDETQSVTSPVVSTKYSSSAADSSSSMPDAKYSFFSYRKQLPSTTSTTSNQKSGGDRSLITDQGKMNFPASGTSLGNKPKAAEHVRVIVVTNNQLLFRNFANEAKSLFYEPTANTHLSHHPLSEGWIPYGLIDEAAYEVEDDETEVEEEEEEEDMNQLRIIQATSLDDAEDKIEDIWLLYSLQGPSQLSDGEEDEMDEEEELRQIAAGLNGMTGDDNFLSPDDAKRTNRKQKLADLEGKLRRKATRRNSSPITSASLVPKSFSEPSSSATSKNCSGLNLHLSSGSSSSSPIISSTVSFSTVDTGSPTLSTSSSFSTTSSTSSSAHNRRTHKHSRRRSDTQSTAESHSRNGEQLLADTDELYPLIILLIDTGLMEPEQFEERFQLHSFLQRQLHPPFLCAADPSVGVTSTTNNNNNSNSAPMNLDALSTSSNGDDASMVPIYLQRNRLKVGLMCPLSLRSAFRMAIAANYPALSVVTILPKPFFADSICNTLLSLIPTASSPVPSTSSTPFISEHETAAEEETDEKAKAEVLAETLPAPQSESPSAGIVQSTLPVEAVAEVPRAKILMVEDNMVNQLVQKKMVTQLGCVCEVANNGQEGLSLFQTQSASLSQHPQLHYQHPQQLHADDSQHSSTSSASGTGRKTAYDLVLMDCQMPIMNGFDATMEIRQYERQCHLEHTHIIGLTAGVFGVDHAKCLDSGMCAVIFKPVKKSDLQQVVLHYLNPQATFTCSAAKRNII